MGPQKEKTILIIGGVPMTRGHLDGKWITGPPVKKPAPSAKAPNPTIKESTRVPKTACKALKRKFSAPQETTHKLPGYENGLQVLMENYKSPKKSPSSPGLKPNLLGLEGYDTE
jgi:hypothetical protein